MQILLVKLILYYTEKMQKKKTFHRFISWQKLKKNAPKNQTISIPDLLFRP